MSAAIVYRFYDTEGALLYVGLTAVGVARWVQHASEQPWWPEVATVTVAHFATVALAADAERRAILAEQPRHNVVHRVPRRMRLSTRPRRPNGAGSIFQRQSDHLWVAQLSHGPRGARQIVRRYRQTRDLAEAALAELTAP